MEVGGVDFGTVELYQLGSSGKASKFPYVFLKVLLVDYFQVQTPIHDEFDAAPKLFSKPTAFVL